jgi:hypothetical protein
VLLPAEDNPTIPTFIGGRVLGRGPRVSWSSVPWWS